MDYGLNRLGRRGVNFVSKLGGLSVLFARSLASLREIHRTLGLFIEQVYVLGVRSLPLIVIVSIFVGAVSAWQAAYQFKFIGAPVRLLGQAVGKAVVIELAPVLTALVFAGRVGAGITAELGTMKVTEQIDALQTLGINPIRYLVLPRLMACLFMLPFLVVIANMIAIFGALAVSTLGVNLSGETFLNGFRDSFALGDFINGLTKAAVFGVTIGLIGCYEGFNAEGGAQGVGRATTNSVVLSSVMILIFNFLFAMILFRL